MAAAATLPPPSARGYSRRIEEAGRLPATEAKARRQRMAENEASPVAITDIGVGELGAICNADFRNIPDTNPGIYRVRLTSDGKSVDLIDSPIHAIGRFGGWKIREEHILDDIFGIYFGATDSAGSYTTNGKPGVDAIVVEKIDGLADLEKIGENPEEVEPGMYLQKFKIKNGGTAKFRIKLKAGEPTLTTSEYFLRANPK